MHRLRAMIRDYRSLALLLLVLAFSIRALVPAGYMLSSPASTVLTIAVCAPASGEEKTARIVLPAKAGGHGDQAEHGDKANPCAFSALSKVAIGGADIVLLAIALAFILIIGLAPVRRPPFRAAPYLLPPLRGPPAAA